MRITVILFGVFLITLGQFGLSNSIPSADLSTFTELYLRLKADILIATGTVVTLVTTAHD